MELSVELTDQYCHIAFNHPVRMISSAILNGGCQYANHFLNVKVDANFNGEKSDFELPNITLQKLVDFQKWKGNCVGMMTAALMSSFRSVRMEKQGVWIEVFVTSGVSNARRAGDKADYRLMNEDCQKIGTINILLATNATLTDASMVECIMMVAEAKAACLQDLKVKSPQSGLVATGTGTDSTAIACGNGPAVDYCGKHVLFGEMLAKASYQALQESLSESK
ncbi:hypothetical protein BZG02_04570 [Labilibaculum filiforme]|uniref:Adenosylcobinamide amidohydrolase n=1 Tax=Labilibaculum filiforme TaxID=1940526 RepID=A0A2N3I478_9BACT|nr:adenosylcobinamide amidohydrolase [Labilibaculum filiforme]PKQ65109.1 hypothetical protein BZG02_04570 [Labilibaculum filiforme]